MSKTNLDAPLDRLYVIDKNSFLCRFFLRLAKKELPYLIPYLQIYLNLDKNAFPFKGKEIVTSSGFISSYKIHGKNIVRHNNPIIFFAELYYQIYFTRLKKNGINIFDAERKFIHKVLNTLGEDFFYDTLNEFCLNHENKHIRANIKNFYQNHFKLDKLEVPHFKKLIRDNIKFCLEKAMTPKIFPFSVYHTFSSMLLESQFNKFLCKKLCDMYMKPILIEDFINMKEEKNNIIV